MINNLPHPLTTQDEVTDEDFKDAGSKLHHTLSKKAKAQVLIMSYNISGANGRGNMISDIIERNAYHQQWK